MSERPDHELEVLEDDQDVPPRPEEVVADASRAVESGDPAAPPAPPAPPAPGGPAAASGR